MNRTGGWGGWTEEQDKEVESVMKPKNGWEKTWPVSRWINDQKDELSKYLSTNTNTYRMPAYRIDAWG